MDTCIVHKWLKAKTISNTNDLDFGIYEDKFYLILRDGLPIYTYSIDVILTELSKDKYNDIGFYVS